MKVLLVSNTYNSFLQHRKNLAIELSKNHQVIVLIPFKDFIDNDLKNEKDIIFKPFQIERDSINPLKDIVTFIHLCGIYSKIKPDIVHHFTIKPVIYGSLAAKIIGIKKIINSITGLGYVFTGSSRKHEILKSIVTILYKIAFLGQNVSVIFQNPDDKNLFEGLGITMPQQSHLILGSGVDVHKFTPNSQFKNAVPKILISARMLWDKGIGELVKASKIMKAKGLEFEIVLAGKTDSENPASIPTEKLEEWSKENIANWIGFQKDMPKIISECDIFCLPSYREGLPMATLEAMACGKPIVTTDVPGCRETISSQDVNGILVPPYDSEALAEALSSLITNKNKREEMGKNSLLHVQNFTKASITKDILKVYEISSN